MCDVNMQLEFTGKQAKQEVLKKSKLNKEQITLFHIVNFRFREM